MKNEKIVQELPYFEVHRKVERGPKPIPPRDPRGDCFAIALTAVLRHFYERTPSFDAVADCCFRGEGTHVSTWAGYSRMIGEGLATLGVPLESHLHFTASIQNTTECTPGWWGDIPHERWFRDLHAYLSAGWLALAFVDADGVGPWNKDGSMRMTNHVVVLDGARRVLVVTRDQATECYVTRLEVHVVDSNKQTGWHEVRPWLLQYGASALYLLRRDDKPSPQDPRSQNA